jgi:hypothetical protein
MRRFLVTVLAVSVLVGSFASLGGCVVVPPRRARIGYVWVPGYYGPHHLWIGEHWRRG